MAEEEEKERKRRKQHKRMEKILARAWELDEETAAFQNDKRSTLSCVVSLTTIGEKLDANLYKLGRHGWEDFARDLGGVYNRHIRRKSKKAALAKTQFEQVQQLLGAKDKSLIAAAQEHVPVEPNGSKKRKSIDEGAAKASTLSSPKKQPKKNPNKELAEREERAMEQLETFIIERGGSASLIDGFRSRVTRKAALNKFDVNFFSPHGRRFRSMLEVGRFFKLVAGGEKAARPVRRAKGGGSRESEAERKRLRKELERLRKAHQRATKALDDFVTDEKETRYPIDDQVLMEDEQSKGSKSASASITPATCAAARIPDIDGFPGIPKHCIPDVLCAWDFLCTFQRALSLSPIALDDFASALAYMPPQGEMGDDVAAPPVYLAEVHLGLIKLLLQDGYSDDWWWSTLETIESELGLQAAGASEIDDAVDKVHEGKPVIKIDMAALLGQFEDPLITASWLKILDGVGRTIFKEDEVKNAIKNALRVVSNKWVHAYLRKTLEGNKTSGKKFMQQAVRFLVDRVRQARPDLEDRSVKKDAVTKAKAKVTEEVSAAMEGLDSSTPAVSSDDAQSDMEYEEDEDSDDSDDEDDGSNPDTPRNEASPASAIPPRPAPSLVDMLLPPVKPSHNAEFINAFSWSHVIGASAHRILHRKKRLLNEVDDYLRSTRELPPLKVPERREREKVIASRVLTECEEDVGEGSPTEKAIEHLCAGGNYLQLSTLERLCLLRLLIEAAYDTSRLYDVVSGNIKQRTSAMKALEVEQRKAKREAKEKAVADEAAAREQLAADAKERFFDEKRDEIRKLNQKSKEFSDDVIESLTEEDILDFDEDFKADYDALPTPDSFNKTEVKKMVARLAEEAAFDTDALRVLTMDELLERERRELEEMEGHLLGFGGEEALTDPSLDRETIRSIERLVRDVEKAKDNLERLPEIRENALEQLKDAMADGTMKVLRGAIAAAKKAKLSGPDDETGGVWAVDLLRDAALEFDNAKQNKRVLDAQKDLVAKRNKCFIRNEPIGRDRFGNRFWNFDNDEEGHAWVETEFLLKQDPSTENKPRPGFLDLLRDPSSIVCGAEDMEEDLMGRIESADGDAFRLFSRREHHSTGFTPSLTKNHWGCHATEESIRGVIKLLDSRGVREHELKTVLKESVEQVGADDKADGAKDERPIVAADDQLAVNGDSNEHDGTHEQGEGDEGVFKAAVEEAVLKEREGPGGIDAALEALSSEATGIGADVRVRNVIDDTKGAQVARYETGRVTGWKNRREEVEIVPDENDMDVDDENTERRTRVVYVPVWRVATDRGHTIWLTGPELVASMCRYQRWKSNKSYFENDAAFVAYRNALGHYCGRANEAPYASSPISFARFMVKREADLYAKLKIRSYDNNWGGKSGQRALWTNSMKDYAFDFQTAKQGLLTLEKAFFELTGEFDEYTNADQNVPNVAELLADPNARHDVELETIEKNVPGLWNSPTSRAVYIEIVNNAKTTGFLALCLDLLCRNTTKYLQTHKLLNIQADAVVYEDLASRRPRRQNAWQKSEVSYEQFF